MTIRTWLACLTTMTLAAACGGDEATGEADTSSILNPTGTSLFDTAVAPDTAAATTEPADTAVAVDSAAEDSAAPVDTAVTDTAVAKDTEPDTVEPVDTAQGPDAVVVPEVVRIVVMGDTGTGSERQYQVAEAIEAKCAADGCDFAVMLGDNIYDIGVESTIDAQWQEKFELPYADIDMPFYAVLGNHDNGGFLSDIVDWFDGAGGEFHRGDIQVAYTQVSSKFKMPARTYDFVKGPAHVFALDTNDMIWSVFNDDAADRTDIQMVTIPGLIDASTSRWKIAMGHHPYRSNGQHGNAGAYEGLEEDVTDLLAALPFIGDFGAELEQVVTGDVVKEALETIVCGRIDLYFAGHDHNRQWIPPVDACPGTTLIVSGAGSKTKAFARDETVTLYQEDEKEGFFWIEIIDDTLTVEAIDYDGHVAWTHQMVKP